MAMADPLLKEAKILTYSDYIFWPDDKRYEIIGGLSYSMAPAPGERHQGVSGELYIEFGTYLRGKKCKVYHAPFDVVLPEKGETFDTSRNVVQPDISVICDKKKITPRGCHGSPDLIIEILSPSTARRDVKEKRKLYRRFSVKEYWIVDPLNRRVDIYKLNKDGYYEFPEVYAEDDKIKVSLFNDELIVDLSVIFAE